MRKDLTMDDLGDLVELRLLGVLATYRRDGAVLLSPVWHEWRDGGFQVVTGSHDVKAAQLRRDPRASIVVCEHTRPTAESRCAATPGSRPRPPAMRYGASPLATWVPRPEPYTPRAPATIFLSAWSRVIFGPGTSPTSSPEAPGPARSRPSGRRP